MFSRDRHILQTVEEFHARKEELELDQDDRLITADVKDFFVVGDHWYLGRMAASILEPRDRHLTEKAILFLLRNQLVTSTLCESGGEFLFEQGSGIGFVASGEISDQVFLGSDGETVYPEAGSVTREAHQSLLSVTETTSS